MRITAAAVLCLTSTVGAFQSIQRPTARNTLAPLRSTQTEDAAKELTKREERLRMMKSDQYYRKGFKEVRGMVEETMESQFQSDIVKDLKSSNYVMEKDGFKIHLAKVRIWKDSVQSVSFLHVSGL